MILFLMPMYAIQKVPAMRKVQRSYQQRIRCDYEA